MKALVFGAAGMLGADLVAVWSRSEKVVPCTRDDCDIGDGERVRGLLRAEKPDIVLLLAAATDVDRCQNDHDYAFGTNSVGAEIVAQACRRAGCPLVYISSIAVFSGEKDSPYNEFDIPAPANVYGLSKYHGEEAVRTFCPDHWIVRTGWLFGGGARDVKFVAKLLRKTAVNSEIRVVRDCVGSPTYTVDFARGLLQLVSRFHNGTYHLVNSGMPASRYELGRETLKIAGYSTDMILPCLSSEIDSAAPRPRMEAALSAKLGGPRNRLLLPDWKDSLAGYVRGTLSELVRC